MADSRENWVFACVSNTVGLVAYMGVLQALGGTCLGLVRDSMLGYIRGPRVKDNPCADTMRIP